jgi:RNA polymerase sigma-70 factor (ECF subfamily)
MGSIEPSQLSRCFDAFGPALVLYARQWLTGASAEDVVQEVFVRLMSQRTAPLNLKAWLFRSVRNAAISELRAARRRASREGRRAGDRPTWFEPCPGDLIDASGTQAALESLPPEQREVIVLRIWCDMGFKEIAEIVALPVSTLFSRYKAGLGEIRRRLELSCTTKNP